MLLPGTFNFFFLFTFLVTFNCLLFYNSCHAINESSDLKVSKKIHEQESEATLLVPVRHLYHPNSKAAITYHDDDISSAEKSNSAMILDSSHHGHIEYHNHIHHPSDHERSKYQSEEDQRSKYQHEEDDRRSKFNHDDGYQRSKYHNDDVITSKEAAGYEEDKSRDGHQVDHMSHYHDMSCPSSDLTCVDVYDCESMSKESKYSECVLYDSDHPGVCCPKSHISRAKSDPAIFRPNTFTSGTSSMLPQISGRDLALAMDKARKSMSKLLQLERLLERRGLLAPTSSSVDHHHHFFGDGKESTNYTMDGYFSLITNLELINTLKLSHLAGKYGLKSMSKYDLPSAIVKANCKPKVSKVHCRRSKYRTPDGSCNNLINPTWGRTFTPFNRLLAPDYGDGINSPRMSLSGSELPNPRIISFTLSPMRKRPSKFFTHLLMQFGQFIDHDIVRTAISRTASGQGIVCCHPAFEQDPSLLHPACLPIQVPENDPFYSRFNSRCMTFVRSAPSPPADECLIGPREQLNQDTSFIDGGQIYGSSKEATAGVRAFEDGLLKTSSVDGRDFLPQVENGQSDIPCNIPPTLNLKCFMAGDSRVNQQLSLVTLQGLFLRYHNKMARALKLINPKWTDETLFQETKRIVTAQIQHITYNEYLPLILGSKVIESFDLQLSESFSSDYDPHLNPQILSGFSSAGFRLHTTVISTIPFRDDHNHLVGNLDLSDTFVNPSMIYATNSYPELLNGLTGVPMASFDRYFSTQLSNQLFRPFNASFGLDLVSINIQRGRDHGIPSYNAWRKLCGLPTFRTFKALYEVMDPEAVDILANLYETVDDIDLWVGGNAEFRLKRAIVGPTFACIIGEQFRRLRFADRFWYENYGQDGSFTAEQLFQIKRTSMASIFCEDEVSNIQKIPFIRPFDKWNPRVECDKIPRISLRPWKDLR